MSSTKLERMWKRDLDEMKSRIKKVVDPKFKRYDDSPKGKARRARYEVTHKARARNERYHRSEKNKHRVSRDNHKNRSKRQAWYKERKHEAII